MMRNQFRVGAVLAATAAAMVGLSIPHAAAASSITAGATMTTTVSGSPSNIWHRLYVSVRLPMNRYDAQGYINNGARVELDCYGDDAFFDDTLLRETAKYTGTTGYSVYNRLLADANGVYLTAVVEGKHNSSLMTNSSEGFNEDFGTDEVFCKATWIDGGGAKLAAFTPVVHGDF